VAAFWQFIPDNALQLEAINPGE